VGAKSVQVEETMRTPMAALAGIAACALATSAPLAEPKTNMLHQWSEGSDAAAIAKLGDRHCQTKFYTACLRAGTRWSSTVFAHELPPRSASFEAENGL
jgi:glucose/mannose transport system substrate-binding protein